MPILTSHTTPLWRCTVSYLRSNHLNFPLSRLFSSSSNGFHPSINKTLNQLNSSHIPRFDLPANAVEILPAPSDFYDTLLHKIAHATDRIFLASLYIGASETPLVDALRQALRRSPGLKVYVLADAIRGTREAPHGPCTASLLAPLVAEFGPQRVQLRLYHTPALHGIRQRWAPKRLNEGWGLQHMKLYGFDDEILLSGANLSRDYFTNRQDRYFVFKSAALTNYYFTLHQLVSSLSYTVVPLKTHLGSSSNSLTFKLVWAPSSNVPEPIKDPKGFLDYASKTVGHFLRQPGPSSTTTTTTEPLTYVYPISQLSPLFGPGSTDASTELPVVSQVLAMLQLDNFNWVFTAGYFNILPQYATALLRSSPPHARVVAASPLANGFYKSQGASGLLPDAYSLLASRFLHQVRQTSGCRQKGSKIELLEWEKGVVNTPDGWSYHAKGIWIFEPGMQSTESSDNSNDNSNDDSNDDSSAEHSSLLSKPIMTIIGSSNYTRRAYAHDLESNALVVTKDPELQKQLSDEVVNILKNAKTMTMEDYEKRGFTPVLKGLTWLLGDKL